MKIIQVGEYTFQIGKNSTENDELVHTSKPESTWFHLTDFPSCHGVINCPIDKLKSQHIFICACNIKNNTKYRKMKKLKVSYITMKYVQPTSTLGRVILTKKPKKIKV